MHLTTVLEHLRAVRKRIGRYAEDGDEDDASGKRGNHSSEPDSDAEMDLDVEAAKKLLEDSVSR